MRLRVLCQLSCFCRVTLQQLCIFCFYRLGCLMGTDVFGVPLPQGSSPSSPKPLCPLPAFTCPAPCLHIVTFHLHVALLSRPCLLSEFLFSPLLLVTPSSFPSLPFCPFPVLLENGRPFNACIVCAVTNPPCSLFFFFLHISSQRLR